MSRAVLVSLLATCAALALAGASSDRAEQLAPAGRGLTVGHRITDRITLQTATSAPGERSTASVAVAEAPPIAARPGASSRFRGRITRNGAPPLAARLTFIAGPNRGALLAANADGTFDRARLYPGFGVVDIEAGGERIRREIRLRHRKATELTIDFGRHGLVTGQVTDQSRAPIHGAAVSLDGNEVVTDASGGFVARQLASGPALLIVHKAGFASHRATVRARAGAPARCVDVVLAPACRLEVRIGGPAAGVDAQVYLFPRDGGPRGGPRGEAAFPWHLVAPRRARPGGVLVFDDLPTCRLELRAVRGSAASPPLRVTPRQGRIARVSLELGPHRGPVQADPNRLQAALTVLGDAGRFLMSQPIELLTADQVF